MRIIEAAKEHDCDSCPKTIYIGSWCYLKRRGRYLCLPCGREKRAGIKKSPMGKLLNWLGSHGQ